MSTISVTASGPAADAVTTHVPKLVADHPSFVFTTSTRPWNIKPGDVIQIGGTYRHRCKLQIPILDLPHTQFAFIALDCCIRNDRSSRKGRQCHGYLGQYANGRQRFGDLLKNHFGKRFLSHCVGQWFHSQNPACS